MTCQSSDFHVNIFITASWFFRCGCVSHINLKFFLTCTFAWSGPNQGLKSVSPSPPHPYHQPQSKWFCSLFPNNSFLFLGFMCFYGIVRASCISEQTFWCWWFSGCSDCARSAGGHYVHTHQPAHLGFHLNMGVHDNSSHQGFQPCL